MLTHLNIRDFLLIDSLEIPFGEGLNILTGETGAGKSLLLDALGLACGERADPAAIRQGAKQARITAVFEMPEDHPVWEKLRHHGVVPDDVLVLNRVLDASGKSRAFINDQPVTAGLLKTVGNELVLVSGQFAAQDLLSPEAHRQALDTFGSEPLLRLQTATAWEQWQDAASTAAALQLEMRMVQRDQEYWQHAAEELAALAPLPDEEQQIIDQRQAYAVRARSAGAAEATLNTLTQPDITRTLFAALRKFTAEGEAADTIRQNLDTAATLLAEARDALEALAFDSTTDQQALEALDDRLYALRAASRKYQVSADGLAGLHQDIVSRQEKLADLEKALAEATQQAAVARQAFLEHAVALRQQRQAAASTLAEALHRELQPLKMPQCRFSCTVEPLPETQAGAHGMDAVTFHVQPNPGVPAAPLHRAASGGELSRLMLALRVVLHQQHPVMVFDEIDSGAGGAVASAIGTRLAALGRKAQVLAITHSPQVAASGDQHWKILKSVAEGVTRTTVIPLTPDERREEVARMLAGETVGEEARAAAGRLLQDSVRGVTAS
jgi:DNA repair protein RecN (Recombination protein N)